MSRPPPPPPCAPPAGAPPSRPPAGPRARSGVVPASVVAGGFGIFRGLRGGLLALDLLGSATLLPGTIDKLAVDKSAPRIGGLPLGVGYGARIGITSGKFPIPAVSVSVMRRTLPRLYFGDLASGDHYAFDSDLKATNVRITAGMRLLALDVAAGIGFDHYSSTAHLRWGTYGISTAEDRKSTRLNSSHGYISYAVFCLKKKKHEV